MENNKNNNNKKGASFEDIQNLLMNLEKQQSTQMFNMLKQDSNKKRKSMKISVTKIKFKVVNPKYTLSRKTKIKVTKSKKKQNIKKKKKNIKTDRKKVNFSLSKYLITKQLKPKKKNLMNKTL